MPKTESNLTDAEWEAKFNGPRDRVLKEIFGDTPCEVKDISPKVIFTDANWEKKNADFMITGRPRVYKPLDTNGLAEWNEQMRTSGKIVTKVREEDLENLKAKPEPVK